MEPKEETGYVEKILGELFGMGENEKAFLRWLDEATAIVDQKESKKIPQ